MKRAGQGTVELGGVPLTSLDYLAVRDEFPAQNSRASGLRSFTNGGGEMRWPRRDKVVEFEDGSSAIMHQNCRRCGKVVDLILRQVSMERFGRTYCFECIERLKEQRWY